MVCDIATALYYPGIDPLTKPEVHVAGGPLFPKPTSSRLMRRPMRQPRRTTLILFSLDSADVAG
jgi:hypothetical protein